jgi:hypothetical protein
MFDLCRFKDADEFANDFIRAFDKYLKFNSKSVTLQRIKTITNRITLYKIIVLNI